VSNTWVPTPLAVIWVVLFAGILLVHAWHAAVMHLRHRLWHIGHCLMAAGMIAMFWPGRAALIPPGVGVGVFAAASAALLIGLASARALGVGLGWLWLLSVTDLAWMIYMFGMMTTRWEWLTVLGAMWFCGQAIAWAAGWLGRVLTGRGLGEPTPPTHPVPSSQPATAAPIDSHAPGVGNPPACAATPVASHGTATSTKPAPTSTRRRVVIDGGPRDYSVRITLTLMAAGMAYMLLAMQFGISPMAHMPPMAPM